ncbi:hypothetical protein O6H91_20G074700 [Diphasiastrum complanatum]|uniref:Uncharacterized protein n=1 Tax=Diphasiastrum complanatum TaxID=34168 RepID=A0ACC2ARV3_DIPCM|nr:hypothetical protein O6H91_20G074700 [Diphasiastrum complanatum]
MGVDLANGSKESLRTPLAGSSGKKDERQHSFCTVATRSGSNGKQHFLSKVAVRSSRLSRGSKTRKKSSHYRSSIPKLHSGDVACNSLFNLSRSNSYHWLKQDAWKNFSFNCSSVESSVKYTRRDMDSEVEMIRRCSSVLKAASSYKEKTSGYFALVQLFKQFQGVSAESNKVLITVTVLGKAGRLRVLIGAHATVNQLIKAALQEYAREGRIPYLGFEYHKFDLHLSQFSHQALPSHNCIKDLGTRSFVLSASKRFQSHYLPSCSPS